MCLEPPGMFNKEKITNVNKIGKTYLIIRGVLCTVIYVNTGGTYTGFYGSPLKGTQRPS